VWGDGTLEDRPTHVRILPARTFSRVSVNRMSQTGAIWGRTRALKEDGTLHCFGNNRSGALGDGTHDDSLVPQQVGSDAENQGGAVANGINGVKSAPTRVGDGSDWAAVSAGGRHTCATKTDGTVRCFGDGEHIATGLQTLESTLIPERVGTESDWTAISCEWQHTCGLRGGQPWCWGWYTTGGPSGFPEAIG
jgi:alpha-tubulin suppressor-like RCC1 family protein